MFAWFVLTYAMVIFALIGISFIKPYQSQISSGKSYEFAVYRALIACIVFFFFTFVILEQERQVYKKAQIDALSGHAIFRLSENRDGTVEWKLTKPYDIRKDNDNE